MSVCRWISGSGVLSKTGSNYLNLAYSIGTNTTEIGRLSPVPEACYITKVEITLSAVASTNATDKYTFLLRAGAYGAIGDVSGSTIDIGNGVSSGSWTPAGSGQALNAYDFISIKQTATNTNSTLAVVRAFITITFNTTTANAHYLAGNSHGNISTNSNRWLKLGGSVGTSENVSFGILPCAGVIKSLYARITDPTTAGSYRTVTFRKGAPGSIADTVQTFVINAGSTSGTPSPNTEVAISAGDVGYILEVPSSGDLPVDTYFQWCCLYIPTTAGEFPLINAAVGVVASASTSYGTVRGENPSSWTTDDLAKIAITTNFVIKKQYVLAPNSPGASPRNYTVSLYRNDSADANLQNVIDSSNYNTVVSATDTQVIVAADEISIQCVPSATAPSATTALVSYTCGYFQTYDCQMNRELTAITMASTNTSGTATNGHVHTPVTLYVTDDGSGTGTTEENPCSLCYAFINARAGDTVLVSPGYYGIHTDAIAAGTGPLIGSPNYTLLTWSGGPNCRITVQKNGEGEVKVSSGKYLAAGGTTGHLCLEMFIIMILLASLELR